MRLLRILIAPVRLLALLLLVLAGLATATLVFPLLRQRNRNRTIRAWSRALLQVCGVRLRVTGVALEAELAATGISVPGPGRLLLANHISWIDVYALDATLPIRFVAKAEIGRWPLVGALVTRVGTLYIERGRRHAVHAMNLRVRDCLRAGETVAVFPEGTTTDGTTLLPFHANLVAPALETGAEVWPVALRYTDGDAPTTAAAFVGEMGLVTSLWNIITASDLAVEVALLPPVPTKLPDRSAPTRHQIAQLARARIAAHLGLPQSDFPSPARATVDSAAEPATAAASEAR